MRRPGAGRRADTVGVYSRMGNISVMKTASLWRQSNLNQNMFVISVSIREMVRVHPHIQCNRRLGLSASSVSHPSRAEQQDNDKSRQNHICGCEVALLSLSPENCCSDMTS